MLSPQQVIALYPPHPGTLYSLFESRVSASPDREFLVFRGIGYGYGETHALVARAAAMYAARGIGPGDRVGVMSRNHITTIVSFLALSRLGATMCPFNPEFRDEGWLCGRARGIERGAVFASVSAYRAESSGSKRPRRVDTAQ